MSHPKWFKLGGYRLRDFQAALDIEEQTLTTVNRQVQLQLSRLREEYDVLIRRKAKLDRQAEDEDPREGDARGGDGVDNEEQDEDLRIDLVVDTRTEQNTGNHQGKSSKSDDSNGDTSHSKEDDESNAPDSKLKGKRSSRKLASATPTKKRRGAAYKCGYCGKSTHNARTCPDKNR